MPDLKLTWKLGLIFFLVTLVFIAGIYIARLSYTGYCFSEGKYLSDQEKLRLVVVHVLKEYPPRLIVTYSEEDKRNHAGPRPSGKVIAYQDVDEFLLVNTPCCEVTKARKEYENSGPTFMEKLTGTVSSFVGMDYWVRYWGDAGKAKSIKTLGFYPISNCGKPTRKWIPGEYFFEFRPSNLYVAG